MLRRGGECAGENFDAMGLLQTLCLVKMDSVDGKLAGVAGKQDQVKTNAAAAAAANAGAANNRCNSSNSASDNCSRVVTEMKGECRESVFI